MSYNNREEFFRDQFLKTSKEILNKKFIQTEGDDEWNAIISENVKEK